ncbi:endogenous retrovirus group K member 7 Pro protein-like [Dipodomys spectabilis]|uniref:endogenous retrovirus group K member 7 Pro protein-like n=1 Tax=Dipodomys spectabilis TaxID=105255 RepID=UPI001C53F02B|nr:endogenous retrovirus group K member 7 Pro protein-like [Dipodomys spectabilis]
MRERLSYWLLLLRGQSKVFPGQRIAQLILLPLDKTNPSLTQKRGSRGFRSSDAYWVQEITQDRPLFKLKLDGEKFEGLMDMGADATIISKRDWSPSWPLTPSMTHLKGIGQTSNPLQSSKILTWESGAKNKGTVQLYVVETLPVNLWGRDILSQMKLIMYSPNELVTQQILNQGFRPGQGLGKHSQGPKEPIQVEVKIIPFRMGYKNLS